MEGREEEAHHVPKESVPRMEIDYFRFPGRVGPEPFISLSLALQEFDVLRKN